jgi:hypothetical protein
MNRREAIYRSAGLLGLAVTGPMVTALLNGCKPAPDLGFAPAFLTPEQAQTIRTLADVIVPRTDTPGAVDVGVPGFIDLMVKDVYSQDEQERFMTGLAAFEEGARKQGSRFADMDAEAQIAYVKSVHDPAVEAAKKGEPKPFILMAKELTLLGFFSSEPGATQVLQYESVPGAYHGCVPLAEVGRAWAG